MIFPSFVLLQFSRASSKGLEGKKEQKLAEQIEGVNLRLFYLLFSLLFLYLLLFLD